VFSPGLRLALAPTIGYRSLAAVPAEATLRAALAGPALTLGVIGTLVSIATTERLTLELAATLGAAWGFAVLIQIVAAAALLGSARPAAVSRRRAFALLFLGRAPWSLWLLGAAASAIVIDDLALTPLAVTMLAPLAWTMVIVAAFCREVLQTSPRGARVRAVVHQAIVWGLALQVAALAAGGWNRLIQGILTW